jgi:hypothetical protein
MGTGRRYQLRKPHEQVLTVEVGRVVCPHRGSVDVELCFNCSQFCGFQEGGGEGLVCSYESILGIPDFSWGIDIAPTAGNAG